MTTTQYVGARYVPLFKGEWDNTQTYEPLCIVSNQGNSYTSRQYVPAGIAIDNEEYWALTGNYNAQVEAYRKEVNELIKSTPNLGFVSVKSYGAKGDGVTDDTVAINNCIKENNLVLIPEGTYVISSEINVTSSNTVIKGSGRTTTVIKQTGANKDCFNVSGTASNYIRNVFLSDFTVKGDFEWRGDYVKNGTTHNGISLSYINLSTFSNINCELNPNDGINLVTHCWALNFDNCLFNTNGNNGFECVGGAIDPTELNGGNLRASNCYFSNNVNSGIRFNGADFVCSNSWIEGNTYGFEVALTNFGINGISFYGCDIEGNVENAFYISTYISSDLNSVNEIYYNGVIATQKPLFKISATKALIITNATIISSLPIYNFGESNIECTIGTNIKNVPATNINLIDCATTVNKLSIPLNSSDIISGFTYNEEVQIKTPGAAKIGAFSLISVTGTATKAFDYAVLYKNTNKASGHRESGDFTIAYYGAADTIVFNKLTEDSIITNVVITGQWPIN